MVESVRRPLRPLPPAERVEALKKQGYWEGEDGVLHTLDATPAEILADENAAPPKEKKMDTKPGFLTSEFWLHAVVGILVLPLLSWLTIHGGVLDQVSTAIAGTNPVLALVAPLGKTAVVALLGWLAAKLTTAYGDNRTALKQSAIASDAPVTGTAVGPAT